MKNISILLIIFFTSQVFSQKKELKQAQKAYNKGDLLSAESIINQNKDLLNSSEDKIKNQVLFLNAKINNDNQNYESAYNFYMLLKSIPSMESEISESLNQFRETLIDKAIFESENKQFLESSKKLYMSYMINTEIGEDYLYYAASNAINGGDYNKALEYYLKLKDIKYTGIKTKYFVTDVKSEKESEVSEAEYNIFQKSKNYSNPRTEKTESIYPEIVKNIALIYAQQLDETDKALEAVSEARVDNPDDIGLILTAAEIYIKLDKKEKFIELVSQAIEKDPSNSVLYFNLGVVNKDLGDLVASRKFYEKAIEIDPKYEAAYFNLTSLILDGESEIVDEMNSLGTSRADNARYDLLKEKRESLYLECVPLLKSLIEINNNPEAIKTLMNIYGTIGDNMGYMEMKKLLE
tara:strand:- start:1063 stop:2286 length:1224 start_codon:yes stop_codon:yes gene_type:complete